MKRLIRWVLGTVVAILIGLAAANFYLERSAHIAAAGPGGRDFHQITAEDLERKVRNEVTIGSTRPFVEDFLTKEGMRFSFDPSKRSVHANAPYVREAVGLFTDRLDLPSTLTMPHASNPSKQRST